MTRGLRVRARWAWARLTKCQDMHLDMGPGDDGPYPMWFCRRWKFHPGVHQDHRYGERAQWTVSYFDEAGHG